MKKLWSILGTVAVVAGGSTAGIVLSTQTNGSTYEKVSVQDDGTVRFTAKNISIPNTQNNIKDNDGHPEFAIFGSNHNMIDPLISYDTSSTTVRGNSKIVDLNVSFTPTSDKPDGIYRFATVNDSNKIGTLILKINVQGGTATVIPSTPDDKEAEASANETIAKVTPKDATKSFATVTKVSANDWNKAYVQAMKENNKSYSFAMTNDGNDIDEKFMPESIRSLKIDHVAKVTVARMFGRLKGTGLGNVSFTNDVNNSKSGYDLAKLKAIWEGCDEAKMGSECKNTLKNLYETAEQLITDRDNAKAPSADKELLYSLLPYATTPKAFKDLVDASNDNLISSANTANEWLNDHQDMAGALKSSTKELMNKYNTKQRNEFYKNLLTAKTASFISASFNNNDEQKELFNKLSDLNMSSDDYEIEINNVMFNDSFNELKANFDNYQSQHNTDPVLTNAKYNATYNWCDETIVLSGKNLDKIQKITKDNLVMDQQIKNSIWGIEQTANEITLKLNNGNGLEKDQPYVANIVVNANSADNKQIQLSASLSIMARASLDAQAKMIDDYTFEWDGINLPDAADVNSNIKIDGNGQQVIKSYIKDNKIIVKVKNKLDPENAKGGIWLEHQDYFWNGFKK